MIVTRKSLRGSTKVRYGLLSAAALVAMSQFASAGTFTWNQPAGGAWTTGANWTGGLPTNLPGDTINLNNNITGAAAITLSANQTMGIMNIGDSTTPFVAFTVGANGGSSLIFNNSGSNAQINKTGTVTTASDVIAAPVVIAGTAGLTVSNSTNSTLTLTGGVTSTGTNSNLVAYAQGSGTITFSTSAINIFGTITNIGTTTTSFGITTGNVGSNVTALYNYSSIDALDINGTLTVNTNGTTLFNGVGGKTLFVGAVTGSGNLILTNDNNVNQIELSGFVNNAGLIINNGTNAGVPFLQGGVGLNVTGLTQNSAASELEEGGGTPATDLINVNSGGTTLTNNGGGAFVLGGGGTTGTGKLILNNNSGTASGINFSGGSAVINNSGTITNSGTGLGSVNLGTGAAGSFIGSNVTGVIQNSPTSSLVLTSPNTYTTLTTINAGTLLVGAGGSLSGSNPLTFTGTGTFNVSENASSTQGMGLLTLTAGEATIQSTFKTTSAILTFANVAARPAGATANFVTSGGTNGTTNKIVLTQFAGSAPPTASLLDIGEFFNGSAYAAYDVGGFVRAYISGDANSSTAAAGISKIVTAGSNVFVTGAITAQTAISVNTLNLANNTLALSAPGTVLNTNGILASGGTTAAITSGTLEQVGTSAGEMVIRSNLSTDKLSIGSIITNNTGVLSLTKSGLGLLVLSGANTYTGVTTVNAGTLQFAQETSLYNGVTGSWTASNIVVNDSATLALNVGGAGFTASDVTTLVGMTSTATTGFVNGSSLGLDTTNAGGTFTYGSVLTNTNGGSNMLGLTKLGAGTLVITGANTYTGITLVNAGTLQLAAATTIFSGDALTVVSGATFDLNGNSQTLGLVNNAGTVTNSNASTINLVIGDGSTGAGAFTGKMNITWNEIATPTTLSGSFNNTGTITNSGPGSGAVSTATISGNIGTNVTGVFENSLTSILLISGSASTYAGPLTVNMGTMQLSGSPANITSVVVNAGGTFNVTAAANTLGGGNASLALTDGTFGVTIARTATTGSFTVSGTTLNTGANAINAGLSWGNGTTGLNLKGITRNTGGTVAFVLPTTGFVNTTTANANFTGGSATILGGWAVATTSIANPYSWAVGGGNIAVFAGFTTVTSGDIGGVSAANAGKDLDLTATTNATAYTSANTLTVNSLRISGVQVGANTLSLALSNPLTIATGGILLSSSSTLPAITITGSTITSGNLQDLVVLDSSTTANTMEIASSIVDNGSHSIGLTFSLINNANNVGILDILKLSGANTFTGDTNINNGILNVNNNLALQDSTLNFNNFPSIVIVAPALTFAPGITAPIFGGLKGNANIGLMTTAVEGVNLSVGNNNQNTTYSGVLSDGIGGPGGALTKIGSGTLALTGVNTYRGATLVSAGKLAIASTGSINTTTGVSINGSTANFNFNGSTAYTQPLSFGASGGTLSGAGTISASGGVSAATNAIVAPGNSPGILTFTTGLTVASSGTYLWANNGGNSNSQVAGTDFSQIAVTAGTVTINSGANLSLSFNATTNFSNAFWTSTETFDLIHKSGTGAVSGTFANGNITISGTNASLSNFANNSLTQGTFSTAITGGDLILTWTPAPTTTATTYTLSAGAGSLNVLLNGTTSASASITNSGTGTADMLNFTGLVSASGAGGIITGTASSGGPLNQAVSSSNTSLTFQGTAYGSATLTPSITTATNATIPGNATNNGTTTAAVNVGEANADNSNSQSSFTGTVLTGTVAASGSYAGLASRVFTATAGSGGPGTLNSEATLLAGTSTNGNTVSMSWRTRITGEVFPNATDPSIPYGAPHGLISDVVRLTGMNLAGGQTRGATVQTDDFVLQMTYSGISGDDEAGRAAEGGIYLAYLDPADTVWTNAVLGNFNVDGNTGQFAMTDFLGSYLAFVAAENTAHPGWTLNDVLGSWGVDTAAATDSTGAPIDGDVWAVLNHNSDFGVLVPEPASLSLLGLGAVGLLASRRRRR